VADSSAKAGRGRGCSGVCSQKAGGGRGHPREALASRNRQAGGLGDGFKDLIGCQVKADGRRRGLVKGRPGLAGGVFDAAGVGGHRANPMLPTGQINAVRGRDQGIRGDKAEGARMRSVGIGHHQDI